MIPHHPCHPKTSSKALIHFPHPHPPPPLHGYSSSHGCTSRCSIRSNSPTSTMLPHSGSRFNLLGEGVRISSFLQSKDILTASFPIASQNYWRLRYIGSGFSMKRLLWTRWWKCLSVQKTLMSRWRSVMPLLILFYDNDPRVGRDGQCISCSTALHFSMSFRKLLGAD